MNRTYIIAEIGINHNGDLDIAKKLIRLAAVAGCDAVKFQKREPDLCVPEHQKSVMRETPWGEMTYLDYKKRIEFGEDEYNQIGQVCADERIEWSASPWDDVSLQFLMDYDVPWIKIPSAMLTNTKLVTTAADWCYEHNRKLIISTGMSSEEEIDKCQEAVLMNCGGWWYDNVVLLHCNSTYPAPLNELNLSTIQTLKEKYECQIGYSGHEFRLGTSVAAVYLGATYIERHVTLDRSMWGTDQLCSVEPQGLIKLVKGIRELEEAYGDGKIQVYPDELTARKKLRGY